MPRIRSVIFALTILAGTALGCESDEPAGPIPPGASNVATSPLGDSAGQFVSFYSAFTTRQRIVVRDANTWARLWEGKLSGAGPSSLPPVDFSTHEVLVAAMGTRPHGGFVIRIERVADTPTQRWVEVHEVTPGNCGTGQAVTSPAIAVVVPRSDKPVTFVERQSVHDCE